MDINELLTSDKALQLIDEGTWVSDFDQAPGVSLLVTGFKSKHAQALLLKKQTAARKASRNKPLTEEQSANLTKEVICETVLRGWKGFTSNGVELEYSPELAQKWIMSRNGEKFTSLVLSAAFKVDSEANDLAEELEKN